MTPTTADLRRWRDDVCAFAEEAMWVRHPTTGKLQPLRLEEHQRAWLTEATRREAGEFVHRVSVASWPKRCGKTLCVSIVLAWRLVTRIGERQGILANSITQAQSNIYDTVVGLFTNSPKLQAFVADDDLQARRLRIEIADNMLTCYPCNHRTIQGARFDCLACDELHASEDGGRAWTFASQQTEARDAMALVSSQAGLPSESNPMWRLSRAAESGDGRVFFDYSQDVCTPWARARAEEAKAELLPMEWAYLWTNAWGATGQTLFAPALIHQAATDYVEPQTAEELRALQRVWGLDREEPMFGVGLDRAGVGMAGDRSVWTLTARYDIAGSEPIYRVLQCAVLPTGSESEVLAAWDRARAICGGYVHKVQFEAYGCSDIVDRIDGAVLVAPSSQRQQGLFTRLHRALAEGRLQFPAAAGVDPKTGAPGLLQAELLQFSAEQQAGGTLRFGVQRGHDDCVYALAWAVDAAASAVRPSIFMQIL